MDNLEVRDQEDKIKDTQLQELDNCLEVDVKCNEVKENTELEDSKITNEDQQLFLKRKREADRLSESNENFNLNNNTKIEVDEERAESLNKNSNSQSSSTLNNTNQIQNNLNNMSSFTTLFNNLNNMTNLPQIPSQMQNLNSLTFNNISNPHQNLQNLPPNMNMNNMNNQNLLKYLMTHMLKNSNTNQNLNSVNSGNINPQPNLNHIYQQINRTENKETNPMQTFNQNQMNNPNANMATTLAGFLHSIGQINQNQAHSQNKVTSNITSSTNSSNVKNTATTLHNSMGNFNDSNSKNTNGNFLLPNNIHNTNPLTSAIPFMNKTNNITNYNFINNLINCSNLNSNSNNTNNGSKNIGIPGLGFNNLQGGNSGVGIGIPNINMPNINNIGNLHSLNALNSLNAFNGLNPLNSINSIQNMSNLNNFPQFLMSGNANNHIQLNTSLKENMINSNYKNKQYINYSSQSKNIPNHSLNALLTSNLNNPFNQILSKNFDSISHNGINNLNTSNVITSKFININPLQNNSTPSVSYPIEDSLLLNNPEKYEVDIEKFERPQLSEVKIPLNYQNNIISIWDFFTVFLKLEKSNDDKNLNSSSVTLDLVMFYENLEKNSIFFKNLLFMILPLYINSCSSFLENPDYSEDKELLILRTLKENLNSDLNIILDNCWLEILRILIDSKKFCLLADENIKLISHKINTEESYIKNIPFSDKISILSFLVNSSYEISKIKELINSDINRRNELARQKSLLETEYRNKEARKREIEKSDKFLNAPSRIASLTKKLEEIENNKSNLAQSSYFKQKKDTENEREKYKSLIKENEEILAVKENIIERLKIIKYELSQLNITSKRLLGKDAYKNEYYLFSTSTVVYVRKYQAYSDEDKKDKRLHGKAQYTWMCYESIETVKEFTDKLLDKGISEKKLKRNLNKFVIKKLSNTCNDLNQEEQEKVKVYEKLENQVENSENIVIEECQKNEINEKELKQNLQETTRKSVFSTAKEILLKIDEKFSEYLMHYNKQWESVEIRNKWKNMITSWVVKDMIFTFRNKPTIEEEENKKDENEISLLELPVNQSNSEYSYCPYMFSNFISSLQMLNLRFKNPYRSDELISDDEDDSAMVVEQEAVLKTRPKYIFKTEVGDEELIVYEFDQLKILSPKVKIYAKELETNEMEKFFNERIITNSNIISLSKFYLALHFYESVIFSLIKRRETTSKKNVNLVKEIEMESVSKDVKESKDIANLNEENIIVKEDENNQINEINYEICENEKVDDIEKTVSIEPDNIDVDKTESFPPSASNSDKKKMPIKEISKRNMKENETSEVIKSKTRGRRPNAAKDKQSKEWRETCYICGEFGDLICCDKCTNVAHLFCACLENLPENWLCESCYEKPEKTKRKKINNFI